MKSRRKTKAQLVKELEALRKINATLGTLLDLKDVLQRIIDEIVPLFAAQAASVILFDSGAQEAEITTAYGSQTLQGKPLRYHWQGSLAGWVAEHQRPLRLSRLITHEWPTSAKLAVELGGSLENISVLLAPLWLNGEVLGCLEIVWDPHRDITNGDEQLLETIATQVAIAIANARLYTERQRTEASLRDSERRLQRMVEHLPAGAVYREGESLFFNAAVERLTGYSNAEINTIDQWFQCLYGEQADQFRQRYEEVRQENFLQPVTGSLISKDGQHRLVDFVAYRSEFSEVWLLSDVTEQRQAARALQESEERYRILSQLISDCAFSYRIEPNGAFFLDWVTDSFYGMTGYDSQEFFARPNPWDRLMSAEAAEQLAQVFQSLGPHSSIVHDFSIIRKDREVRWLRGYLHSVSGARGAPTRIYGAVQDITERKHAEDALRQSEERYRIISQCISDYAFSFRIEDDKVSFMEWLTESFTRVTGYPISDFLGKSNPWARYIHPQDLERVNATVRQMQPGVPTTYEFRIIRRDGETRWIRSYAYAVRGEKGSVTRLYGAAQDITERKHAEDMLRYQRVFEQLIANISKDFLNLAPEEIDQGVLRALHMVGEFSSVDRSYVFLFHENLTTMDNTHEWCAPGIAPMQSQLRNIATNTLPWLTRTLKNLEVVHIPEVNTLPSEAQAEKLVFQAQGIQSLMSVPLVSGKALIGLLGFDAVQTTKRWTEESLLLLKVVGEMIVNALERKWAADRQQHLHAQLLQTQKLEAIGILAGGIAHDFNNILAAIMGYTELATDDVPSESLTHRNLESVLAASRRARGLVQQLLTFSRPSHLDRRPIQLHKIVQNTLTLLRASFPKHIDIHLALQQPIDTIFADPNQIEQVVMNLCVNAAYAIGEHHGVLGIGIDYVVRERATDLVRPGLSIPAAYCLTISDTGCGIAPETLAHIFEPFFTTKPVGQGSGMGLAIVHSIVTSHGGSIAVESHPGQGTTFRVYFPSFQERIATATAGTIPLDQDVPP